MPTRQYLRLHIFKGPHQEPGGLSCFPSAGAASRLERTDTHYYKAAWRLYPVALRFRVGGTCAIHLGAVIRANNACSLHHEGLNRYCDMAESPSWLSVTEAEDTLRLGSQPRG